MTARASHRTERTSNGSWPAGERESREERYRPDASGPGVVSRCSSMKCEKSVKPSLDIGQCTTPEVTEESQQASRDCVIDRGLCGEWIAGSCKAQKRDVMYCSHDDRKSRRTDSESANPAGRGGTSMGSPKSCQYGMRKCSASHTVGESESVQSTRCRRPAAISR